ASAPVKQPGGPAETTPVTLVTFVVWGSIMRAGRLGAVTLVAPLGGTSWAAVSAARTTRSSTCATLSPGAIGPAVAAIQRLVKADADGEFGPMTDGAVTRGQE